LVPTLIKPTAVPLPLQYYEFVRLADEESFFQNANKFSKYMQAFKEKKNGSQLENKMST